jgi:hypothetical protein
MNPMPAQKESALKPHKFQGAFSEDFAINAGQLYRSVFITT